MADEPTTQTEVVTETTTQKPGVQQVVTSITVTPRERIAVVKATPRRWYASVGAKLTVIVSSNLLFQFIWQQVELIRSFELPVYAYLVGSGIVLAASLAWVIYVIWEDHTYNKYQKEIDELLLTQNSTPDNLAQLIPADQVDLYRYRGFKIITRGESNIAGGPQQPVERSATPQGQ